MLSQYACTKKELQNITLFHVTEQDNLEKIFAKNGIGLETQISDLTVQVYADAHPDIDFDEAANEIENKFGYIVFATTFDHVLEANKFQFSESEHPVVLGIKSPCDKYFRHEEINADFDWISNKNIPSSCLCIWGKIKKK